MNVILRRIPVKKFTRFAWNSSNIAERVEALFCLDFLGTFCVKTKSTDNKICDINDVRKGNFCNKFRGITTCLSGF